MSGLFKIEGVVQYEAFIVRRGLGFGPAQRLQSRQRFCRPPNPELGAHLRAQSRSL